MGQQEVLDLLNMNDRWLTLSEIRELLNSSSTSLIRVLKCLRHSGFIQFKRDYKKVDNTNNLKRLIYLYRKK